MNFINQIAIASIDSATFTGNLQAINSPSGLPNSCSIIRIVNNSDRDITISFDGTTNHDFLPDGGTYELNLLSGKLANDYGVRMQQGTIVYVSGLAGGTGLVYLSGYY